MKKLKVVVGIVVPLLLVLALAVPAAANGPVEPPEVTAELNPGATLTVTKSVRVPEILPKPDIYFLADTTGSMGAVIETVADNAEDIMAAIAGLAYEPQFGVGNYKDFPYDSYAYQHQLDITDDTAAVAAAMDDWVTVVGGGVDLPEGQFYALDRLAAGLDPAGDPIGWRADSSKIVVWIGDAPAHDPVPDAATGLGYDITETTVTDALVAAGIRVIAISIDTGYYEDGLDDDPTDAGGDYAAFYGITEDGTPGQASRIATATGGVFLLAATPEEVVDAIMEGLQALSTDVWWTVEADDGLTVTLDPEVMYDVPSGTTVEFVETIMVAEDAPQCETLSVTVTFWANSYPEEGAVIGVETISIKVNDITPPVVWSVETANPHGQKVPPAGWTTLPGAKGGMNEDGFYVLLAWDNCDPDPMIFVTDGETVFGPFPNGTVVKFTEDPTVPATCKKMGSDKGKAAYVSWHIILPTDPIVMAVDASGNVGWEIQLVPPAPK